MSTVFCKSLPGTSRSPSIRIFLNKQKTVFRFISLTHFRLLRKKAAGVAKRFFTQEAQSLTNVLLHVILLD